MKEIKSYVNDRLAEIAEYIIKNNLKIKLTIINVGNNQASQAYIRGKVADTKKVGITCEVIHFEDTITEAELLDEIDKLNKDNSVTGLIVQLPLPKHINETTVAEAIAPEKDVDGFSRLALVSPATPQGIIDYLEYNNYEFVDKNAVVIGRSNIVGRPIAKLLLDRSCNVSVIHSKTSEENKHRLLQYADLIVVATGHRNTIVDSDLQVDNENYVIYNNLCKIIDVGINKNDEGKLCGDCESVTVCEKTPVPGGVGLTTRLALITNLIKLYKIAEKSS